MLAHVDQVKKVNPAETIETEASVAKVETNNSEVGGVEIIEGRYPIRERKVPHRLNCC